MSSTTYFYCETNPWDNVLGLTNTIAGIPKEVQTWNEDPLFSTTPAPQPQHQQPHYNTAAEEGRYDSVVRSAGGVRSIGTIKSQYHPHSVGTKSTGTESQNNSVGSTRSSDRGSRVGVLVERKNLRDIKKPPPKTSWERIEASRITRETLGFTENVLREGKKKPPPKTPWERIEASRLTRQKLHQKYQNIKLHAMAESSRPKKELTAEDIRDPETIPGMKCQVEMTREKEAKNQAVTMISDDYYKHDNKAGIAVYSVYDLSQRVPSNGEKIGPIV